MLTLYYLVVKRKMKKEPKPIKARAIVDKEKLKLTPFDIYDLRGEIGIDKDERECLVEIRFIKWL